MKSVCPIIGDKFDPMVKLAFTLIINKLFVEREQARFKQNHFCSWMESTEDLETQVHAAAGKKRQREKSLPSSKLEK